MNRPSNPTAFPRAKASQPEANRQHWSVDEGAPGMTLLDYFAAKALTMKTVDWGAGHEARTAQCAYAVARAMLAEREKHL